MDDWKRLISRGKRCFERGGMANASAVYQDALFIVESRLGCLQAERLAFATAHGSRVAPFSAWAGASPRPS